MHYTYKNAYISCANRNWFWYALLWWLGLVHSSALPTFSEDDECQECSSPQLTASRNCVTATCYVNRPAFHHQYLSERLHTGGTTAPPYYSQLMRLHTVTILEESPELTLHARLSTMQREDDWSSPEVLDIGVPHGQTEPNNHTF